MSAYMPGAEPFELSGADAGVLLLHGFSGSCSEIRALGRTLNEAGYGVSAPALAGHGTSPSDLINVRPDDFFAGADAAYHELRRRFARVYVVGLSLGGTLGLHLATRYPFEGLVTISTPVFMSPLVSWSVPFAKRWMPERNVISNYAAWRGEVVGYRTTPFSSIGVFMDVLALVKKELPRVEVPLLLLHSTGDRTAPVANAPYIASRVSSAHKTVRVYSGGRHLLTLPPYLSAVQMDVVRFLHAQEAPYVTGSRATSKGASLEANEVGRV
jgi:carboxylesterase